MIFEFFSTNDKVREAIEKELVTQFPKIEELPKPKGGGKLQIVVDSERTYISYRTDIMGHTRLTVTPTRFLQKIKELKGFLELEYNE